MGELHGTFSILPGLNFKQCSFHSFGHTFCFLSNVNTRCYCSVNFEFISGELHGMFSILIT
jgi:hypothetical protein